jgi:hypothetical protein
MPHILVKITDVGGNHGVFEHHLLADKALDKKRPESSLRDSLGKVSDQ